MSVPDAKKEIYLYKNNVTGFLTLRDELMPYSEEYELIQDNNVKNDETAASNVEETISQSQQTIEIQPLLVGAPSVVRLAPIRTFKKVLPIKNDKSDKVEYGNSKEVSPTKLGPIGHFIETELSCEYCKFTTVKNDKMDRHVKTVHLGQNPFACLMCDYTTYNKTRIEEHTRWHQGEKPFQCNDCSYRSGSKSALIKHRRRHNSDNPLYCKVCSFIAQNKAGFSKHEREGCAKWPVRKINRVKITKYKCECGTLSTKNYLLYEKHKEICAGAVFQCEQCLWSSNSHSKILLHLIHHPKQEIPKAIDASVLEKYGIIKSKQE